MDAVGKTIWLHTKKVAGVTKKFVRWYTGDAIVIFNNLKRNCETVETIYKNKKARQSAERSQDELKRNAFLA